MNYNIKVNMDGKEYVNFIEKQNKLKEEKNKKINKFLNKHKYSIIFGSAFVILLIVVLSSSANTNPSIFERWASISWSALLKIGFCVVLISWLIHGVKVRLLA